MDKELNDIIAQVKQLISRNLYNESEAVINTAMFQHPHSPVPHNLMGLLLEEKQHHDAAMRHFRAACDLDPDYEPSSHNLDSYGVCTRTMPAAYFISDCKKYKKF